MEKILRATFGKFLTDSSIEVLNKKGTVISKIPCTSMELIVEKGVMTTVRLEMPLVFVEVVNVET